MQYENINNKNKKSWKVWWKLTRPHTLTAGFIPVLIGSALALESGEFNPLLFMAMLISSLLIQSATNMFNEYYDFKRGLDHEGSVGIGGTIVREGVQPLTIMKIALSFYFMAIIIGIYICAVSSWWLIVIGLISMAAGFLYTGGPLPIAYTPFGEIFAGFFMGYVIIAISYFIQTLDNTLEVAIVSIPTSLLIANILSANNIRDLDGDKIAGRKTLAIILGKRNAVVLLSIVSASSYLIILLFPIYGLTSFWTYLAFLSLPLAIKGTKEFIKHTTPLEMMPAMVAIAKTNTVFGLLFSIGMFLGYFL